MSGNRCRIETSRSWTAAVTARTNSSFARSLLCFSFRFAAARLNDTSRISSAVGIVGVFSNSTPSCVHSGGRVSYSIS